MRPSWLRRRSFFASSILQAALSRPDVLICVAGPGNISFDVSDADARDLDDEGPRGVAVRARFEEYGKYLASIGQEQVLETIADALSTLRHAARRT